MSPATVDGLIKVVILLFTAGAQYLHLLPPGSLEVALLAVGGYHVGQNVPSTVTKFLSDQADKKGGV